jgi:hypothetical protein
VGAGWDGIHSAFMPGVALAKPSQCEITTFNGAMVLYCFNSIAGAAGIETTVITHERTQRDLVAANKENQNSAHFGTLGSGLVNFG